MTPDMEDMKVAIELFGGVRPAARVLALPASTACMVRYGHRRLSPERSDKVRQMNRDEQARRERERVEQHLGRIILAARAADGV